MQALGTPRTGSQALSALSTQFTGCVESIGVGLVSTQQAQALVPSPFQVVGANDPVTPFVMRTARCEAIKVEDFEPTAGVVVQVGAIIVPPDYTGDINNYTLWYYTSSAKLAHHLMSMGVDAQHVPTLDYFYTSGSPGSSTPLSVSVSVPGNPSLTVAGSVVESQDPSGSFDANWWAATEAGTVKMRTQVPVIHTGSASLTLTTDSASPLGQFIGGSSTGFPVLEQFNTYPNAHLDAHFVSP